ncbi:uncharacterized protein LOC134286836 [Aedes albopictus]|uniref:FLYWCH-type domain-containing protein n=1 Tax=Aedes albopictus TaxID=7160 RepID=A0ABM1Y470_AEDAL
MLTKKTAQSNKQTSFPSATVPTVGQWYETLLTFATSAKGNKVLDLHGYRLCKKKTTKHLTWWSCISKSCKARSATIGTHESDLRASHIPNYSTKSSTTFVHKPVDQSPEPIEVHRAPSISGAIKFVRSQKKNAQLVYKGFLYNRKLTQQNGNTTWRCIEVTKLRCKAICVTKFNKLILAKRQHSHENHESKIRNRPLYDYPEDLEEYLDIFSREPISASQKLDVIDDGTDYKLVVRDTIEEVVHGAPGSHIGDMMTSGTNTFYAAPQ